ncbi:MAG TPA: hypothetical protein VLK65_06100 [Vicinamibacteria bacterium]|nr:hypothetical protein [Vicinamibacteria bacterium]
MARLAEPNGRRRALLFMTLRLLLFVTVAFWVDRSFGSLAAISVLAGAVVTRGAFLIAAKKA